MNLIASLWRAVTAAKQICLKYHGIVVVTILILLLAMFIGHHETKTTEVALLPQQQAQKTAGIQSVADAARVPLSRAQTGEAASKISKTTVGKASPDYVVQTTGAGVAQRVKSLQKDNGADFALITDAQNPAQKPVLKPEEPIKLQVYNIKAYPRAMVEAGIGLRGIDIACLRRVNVPRVSLLLPKGTVGYAGPFVRREYGSGKVDAGLRLVVTF